MGLLCGASCSRLSAPGAPRPQAATGLHTSAPGPSPPTTARAEGPTGQGGPPTPAIREAPTQPQTPLCRGPSCGPREGDIPGPGPRGVGPQGTLTCRTARGPQPRSLRRCCSGSKSPLPPASLQARVGQSSGSGPAATLTSLTVPQLCPPHLAPTSPGSAGPVSGRPRCSSSPLGRVCRSPGRHPQGTWATGHHSAHQGHTGPSRGGTALQPASPGSRWPRSPWEQEAPSTHTCPEPGPQAHPALVAAGAVGTLGPLGQQAGAGVAAAVLTVLRGGRRQQRSKWAAHREPCPCRGKTGRSHPAALPVVSGGVAGCAGHPGLRNCPACRWELGPRAQTAEGGGAQLYTSGRPQSHCSPRSRNPFPHTGPPTSRSRSGVSTRQAVRRFSRNVSRSARLQ